jgi:mannan endo-1,4-beta-mannosidase
VRRRLQLTAALLAAATTLSFVSAAAATTTATGVTASGGHLYLNGKTRVLNGINAYNATTYWNVNYGCGSQVSNLDSLFNSIPSGSLVRTWAFQALGFNKFTHRTDFTAIDRAVAAAKAHDDYLIFALSDQSGNCDDGHWHDKAWYDGGYTKTYNDNGRGFSLTMNYLTWVKTVVARYASDPTVAIYEPVNEPEASNCNTGYTGSGCYGHNTCPTGATGSLRSFFDNVGAAIKSLDSRAIVSTGMLGGNQCGVAGTGFSTINASSAVDVATYHDYNAATTALPTALSTRASQTSALGKVFLIEESGISASTVGLGCPTLSARSSQFLAKISAAKNVGADGYLPWNWAAGSSTTCSLTIAPGDPLLKAFLAGTA